MKIIITGATGFIGAATLSKALDHPTVTKIVAYTRRPLPQQHPKLENIVKDHLDILGEEDSALIWCAGVKLGVSIENARKLEEAAISAAKNRNRFVYLSGMLAVKDQSKTLWFADEARKLKGQTETELAGEEHYIARPSMVTQDWAIPMTIRVDDLATVLLDLAVNGNSQKTWENADMVARAQELKQVRK